MKQAGSMRMAKGTVAAAALGGAASKVFEFDGQIRRVKALSNATSQEFEKMKGKAIELGSTTAFTSTQAAQGMEYLALAGFKTNEIMEAMPGLLDLAAASGEDLGMVSDIVSDNLTVFGLKAQDTGRLADVMAKTAASSNTNVAMLGEAFK